MYWQEQCNCNNMEPEKELQSRFAAADKRPDKELGRGRGSRGQTPFRTEGR